MTRLLTIAMVVSIVLSGIPSCGDEGAQDGIDPGLGVTIGGESLRLGDTYSAVESRFGAPATLRDLDSLGVHFTLPSVHLAGFFSESGSDAVITSLTLEQGFSAHTPGGIGIGSDEATVRSELGAPLTDSFTTNWWYHETGMVVEWAEGAVDRIHIVPPR